MEKGTELNYFILILIPVDLKIIHIVDHSHFMESSYYQAWQSESDICFYLCAHCCLKNSWLCSDIPFAGLVFTMITSIHRFAFSLYSKVMTIFKFVKIQEKLYHISCAVTFKPRLVTYKHLESPTFIRGERFFYFTRSCKINKTYSTFDLNLFS